METMGPLSTKHGDSEVVPNHETPCSENDETKIFYAVFIPADAQVLADQKDYSSVFKDKSEALKLVKKYKRARFKACTCVSEATRFSLNGGGGCGPGTPQQPNAPAAEPAALTGEKPSPFKGPKSQELVHLRKAIESGDLQFVQKTVWDNPRYLVSSGDTPSILHEGTRFNAVHVCAKTGNASICALVLKTISNIDFIRRLYGDTSESAEAAEDRCQVLLDLYLNTPDKGFNETPLHFASKHGSVEVVKVLVAYPQCIKNRLNKHGQSPKDIICSRVTASGDNGVVSQTIRSLLDDQYFVPVLRSCDPTVEPAIGQPFSPKCPLDLSGDIKSPPREVQGVAGPMTLEAAKAFRKNWKTPPRDVQSPLRKAVIHDSVKGLENIGRKLAQECNVPWKEYWPFLETFTDFSSEDGLDLLENYLMKRFKQETELISGNRTNNLKNNTLSPSKLPVITNYNNNNNNNLRNAPVSDAVNARSVFTSNIGDPNAPLGKTILSPISELCMAMQSCRLSEGSKRTSPVISDLAPPPQQSAANVVKTEEAQEPLSLHLYIEKSCQVFAKRITDGLLICPESGAEVLTSEAAHLNTLISSYMNDERFVAINFSRFHNRIAKCLVRKLDSCEADALTKAVAMVTSRQKQDKNESSSEDEALITTYRDRDMTARRLNCKRRKLDKDVQCVAQQITRCLQERENETRNEAELQPKTEAACIEAWEAAAPCACEWTVPAARKLSFRRSRCFGNFACRRDFQINNEEDQKCTAQSGDKRLGYDCSEESAGEESDMSDADCDEFFTPPSTPRDQRSLSSEDEFDMDSPDEGPDIYIVGDCPTYLDNAVLDALDQSSLNPNRYPNICRWMHLVSLHPPDERESWAQSGRLHAAGTPQSHSSFTTPHRNSPFAAETTPQRHSPFTPQRSTLFTSSTPQCRSSFASRFLSFD